MSVGASPPEQIISGLGNQGGYRDDHTSISGIAKVPIVADTNVAEPERVPINGSFVFWLVDENAQVDEVSLPSGDLGINELSPSFLGSRISGFANPYTVLIIVTLAPTVRIVNFPLVGSLLHM